MKETKKHEEIVITIDDNNSINNTDSIVSISLFEAIKSIGKFSAPFTLSRVAVAINVIANGRVISRFQKDAAAAGPLMTPAAYGILGFFQAVMSSAGILAGDAYGESIRQKNLGNLKESGRLEEKIGKISQQSLGLGFMLAIPTTALMLFMKTIFKHMGIPPAVAKEAQSFLTGLSTGVLPIYWSTGDQQLALATGNKNIPLVIGGLYSGLSMTIGFLMALKGKLGPAGLGYGMSSSAWITFVLLRIYFARSEFKPYKLYDLKWKEYFNDFSQFLKLGLPMGFQAFTEGGNLLALSILVGLTGSNNAIASLATFQIVSAFSLMSTAFGKATGVKISNLLGDLKPLLNKNQQDNVGVLAKNIKTTNKGALILGASINVILSGAICFFSKPILSFFISSDNMKIPMLLSSAEIMLYTNAAGLVIDTVRNTASGGLNGSKDVLYAPAVSFLTTSIAGLGLGAVLTRVLDMNVDWLFITRYITITVATVAVVHRIMKTSYTQENQKQDKEEIISEITENSPLHPVKKEKKGSCLKFFDKKESMSNQESFSKGASCQIL